MKKSIIALTAIIALSVGTAGQVSASSTHTVKSGDTLWSISQQNKVSVKNIQTWNKLNSTTIYPNQNLIVKNIGNTVTSSKTPVTSSDLSVAKEMTVTATAYTANCAGCSGITATGINLKANPNKKVISVDPSVIPLGSRVWVEGYGEAVAGDTGGAIKGNKIDVFIPTKQAALNWGKKTVNIKVLN